MFDYDGSDDGTFLLPLYLKLMCILCEPIQVLYPFIVDNLRDEDRISNWILKQLQLLNSYQLVYENFKNMNQDTLFDKIRSYFNEKISFENIDCSKLIEWFNNGVALINTPKHEMDLYSYNELYFPDKKDKNEFFDFFDSFNKKKRETKIQYSYKSYLRRKQTNNSNIMNSAKRKRKIGINRVIIHSQES